MLAARAKNKKRRVKALPIHRPDPSMIETLEVPVNGEHHQSFSRIDRLAALIVAVEKLL